MSSGMFESFYDTNYTVSGNTFISCAYGISLSAADNIIITNLLHFAEVYYYLLVNYNEKTADYWASKLKFSFLN